VLASVLARLEAISGVVAARVDSSGRFFWLTLGTGVDVASVAALATGSLGAGARLLGPAEAEDQLAAYRAGDPWFGADEVMTLSFVEARIVSVRIAGEAEREAGADPAQREAIAEAVRLELFGAMERVHAEGGRGSSGWIYREWPAIAEAIVGRCAASVPEELLRRLAELLPGILARGALA
jgi:hypothetical protein